MAEEAAFKSVKPSGEQTGIRRILTNTGRLLGGKGIGGVLSIFYLAVLTRTLGVTGFGQFVLITGAAQAIILIDSFKTWQVVVWYGVGYLQGVKKRQNYVWSD